MRTFPSEFSSLLKPKVWSQREAVTPIAGDRDRLRWFPLALRPAEVSDGLALLERVMTPHLRRVLAPVDPALIANQKENYTEALPKTIRNASVGLNTKRSAAYASAERIGLVRMLTSASLHQFASAVTGYTLHPEPSLQIIRYEAGDYVGPHNDHHPENEEIRRGYVDLQITLSDPGVARQYLLYEAGDGYFNHTQNIGIQSGVSVSMLPFWHQVTPLEVKPGHPGAHRWLLLVSFDIDFKAKNTR
jgi:hypothetical protein